MTAIATTITQIIVHTPIWVWFVLLLLVWRGLISTQPRAVRVGKLLLLPLALVGVSAYGILETGVTGATIAGMVLGALTGVATGLGLERRHPATLLNNGQILLAGEWTPLFVILAIFFTRYAGAVTAITAPDLANSAQFLLAMGAISAFSSVMLVTRTMLRLRVLQSAPALTA